jgi:signal transduction histidine kinase
MVSYVGLSEDVVREEISYELGEGVTGKAAQTGKIIVVDDVDRHADSAQRKGIDLPQTQISIPLVTVPGQLLGVLNVANSERKVPAQDELSLLKTVAHQIALAIDKAQLYTAASMRADELEGIVEARTEQLAQAIDELSHALEKARETDKLKSMLLSTVSHELRTPLATIKGTTSMLVEHHQQIDAETLKEHLGDIEAETDKLTGLISDLLEMSRIESGMLHIQPQPFDLADTLRSTINAAQVRLGNHIVSLAASDGLAPCYGDARRVEQIVDNLLENAAKYSPEGSPINIRVEGRGEELVVSVADKGEGIAPEHLEYIFDRFYQVRRGRDAGRGGIGLGLAICRGLVEAHGGKIWVESTPGEGSTFFFSLPTATAQGQHRASGVISLR